MKFSESYDPSKEEAQGGVLVNEGEISGEYPPINIEDESEEDLPNEQIDSKRSIYGGEAEEGFESSTELAPSSKKIQSEIQAGIDTLREKIEKHTVENKSAQEGERVNIKERVSKVAHGEEQIESREVSEMNKRVLYEDERASVFNRITPLEKAVENLNHTITLESDELAYLRSKLSALQGTGNASEIGTIQAEVQELEERVHENTILLQKRKQSLKSVSTFEEKLWGDVPDDLSNNTKALFSSIKQVKSAEDLLAVFDTWGALPGVDSLSKPLTDRETVEHFLESMNSESEDEVTLKASKIFENPVLRDLALGLPRKQKHEEVETLSTEPEIRPFSQQPSQEELEIQQQKELRSLYQEEKDLTKSKEILSSNIFRLAPFLMKVTKGGREKLSVLKRVGLSPNGVRTGGSGLEFARMFKLKAVKEKKALIRGHSDKNFSHDVDKRFWSEDQIRQNNFLTTNDVRMERMRDKEQLEHKDTRQKNRIAIGESLKKQAGKSSIFVKLFSRLFKSQEQDSSITLDGIIMPKRHEVFEDKVAEDTAAKTSFDTDSAERSGAEEDPIVEISENQEKRKIQKQQIKKVKTDGKPKARTRKKSKL